MKGLPRSRMGALRLVAGDRPGALLRVRIHTQPAPRNASGAAPSCHSAGSAYCETARRRARPRPHAPAAGRVRDAVLAGFGADVVKIEDPRGGDGMRTLPTSSDGRPYFELLNRGKRSVTLDSAIAGCGAGARRAARDGRTSSSTAFGHRQRGASASRRRRFARRHPRLICASISGFDRTGAARRDAAHDLNYQALAGLLTTAGNCRVRSSATSAPRCRRRSRSLPRSSSVSRPAPAPPSTSRIQDAADAWSMFPDHRRSGERLLRVLRNGGWRVARARRARSEVLARLLRADRPAPISIPLQHAAGA